MAVSEQVQPWRPVDTFGTRLAIVRQQLGGWTVKRVADLCELDDTSWRNWERGMTPRSYLAVCRQIADRTGVDYAWLVIGGPLNSLRYGPLIAA